MKRQKTARIPVDLADRRISLLNDVIFHYVFAHEQGTQCLKILVNTVLENAGLPLAEDLIIRSPFNLAEYLQTSFRLSTSGPGTPGAAGSTSRSRTGKRMIFFPAPFTTGLLPTPIS